MIPLNATQITRHLSVLDWHQPLEIMCLETIASTNDYLKHHVPKSSWSLCVAESQTAGKGRLGRHWHSPQGGNLYLSLRFTLPCPMKSLHQLSLVTGLGLLSTLKKIGFPYFFQLKWPNDIFFENQKLGGILIEILETNLLKTEVLIGVGLNVTHCPSSQEVEQAVTSLHLLDSSVLEKLDRNRLIAYFITTLDAYLQRYLTTGWESFLSEWDQVKMVLS